MPCGRGSRCWRESRGRRPRHSSPPRRARLPGTTRQQDPGHAKPVGFRHSRATVTSARRWKSGRRDAGRAQALRTKGERTMATTSITGSPRQAVRPGAPGCPGHRQPDEPCPPRVSAACPPGQQAGESDFPVSVVDDEGTEVIIEAPAAAHHQPLARPIPRSSLRWEPETASWAARTTTTTLPRPPTSRMSPPSPGVVMEQVVGLDPDLVLAAGNDFTKPDEIARMRELGYPVVVVYAPDVPTVLADIELIGRAIGEEESAAALVDAHGRPAGRHQRGRRSPGRAAADLLRARLLRRRHLRPGLRLIRGRHGRAGRRRGRHDGRPGALRDAPRAARRGRPGGHRARRCRLWRLP